MAGFLQLYSIPLAVLIISMDTPVVKQVVRGCSKQQPHARPKLALQAREVSALIKQAETTGELDIACLISVARLFMLRVPSEGVPLQWTGLHSSIILETNRATVTLTRRKHCRQPCVLVRQCCCRQAGRRLCAVHWLHRLSPTTSQLYTPTITATSHRTTLHIRGLI